MFFFCQNALYTYSSEHDMDKIMMHMYMLEVVATSENEQILKNAPRYFYEIWSVTNTDDLGKGFFCYALKKIFAVLEKSSSVKVCKYCISVQELILRVSTK